MKIKTYLILCFVFIPFVYAETVYKTRDAEGNIIFSDVPSEGAETIEIQEAQTVNIPELKRSGNRPTTKLEPKDTVYSKLEILSPEDDMTIHSNEGKVSIKVEVEPVLSEEDYLVLFMDGKEVSSGKSTQILISDLDRGTHSINVVLKNEKDKVLKQSQKLVFHLRKQSRLFKNRGNIDTDTPDNAGVVTEIPENTDSAPIIPSL